MDRRIRRAIDLATEAADGSERIAAPVAAWLSAKAGHSPQESIAVARRVNQAPGA
jgi:hypothetical protein